MLKEWMKHNLWKRQLNDVIPAPDAGGEGGAPGSGGGGGEPKPEEPKTPPAPAAEPPGIDPEEHARVKAENEKLVQQMNRAAQFVEIDPLTGDVKPKVVTPPPAPSADEAKMQEIAQAEVRRSEKIDDAVRTSEGQAMAKFKTDPLFEKTFPAARKYVEMLPKEKRTLEAWEKAYALASGENLSERIKSVEEAAYARGRAEALAQAGASLPAGGAGAPPVTEVDLSKVQLSQTELHTAKQMVRSGMIKSIEDYKRNKVLRLRQREEEEVLS